MFNPKSAAGPDNAVDMPSTMSSSADWAPSGDRIVFDHDGEIVSVLATGGDRRVLAEGEDPDYSPGGTLAFVRDGAILVRGRVVANGGQPAWQPGTAQLAYANKGHIYVTGRTAPVAEGTQPAFPPPQSARRERQSPHLEPTQVRPVLAHAAVHRSRPE